MIDTIVQHIVDGIRAGVNSEKQPERTRQLTDVLKKLADDMRLLQYDKSPNNGEWMGIDYWWWAKKDERAWLAAESQQWTNEAAILEDFEKLPSLKSDIKLMVFDAPKLEAESLIRKFEKYLSAFSQHIQGERYLVAWLDRDGGQWSFYEFNIPNSGKLTSTIVQFVSR